MLTHYQKFHREAKYSDIRIIITWMRSSQNLCLHVLENKIAKDLLSSLRHQSQCGQTWCKLASIFVCIADHTELATCRFIACILCLPASFSYSCYSLSLLKGWNSIYPCTRINNIISLEIFGIVCRAGIAKI